MDVLAGWQIDLDLLREFERGLDPPHPERSKIPARILGYGEISTVFEIQGAGLEGLAFKRLPIFRSAAEVERYRAVYEGYTSLLEDEIGLQLPAHGYAAFADPQGRPVFYIIQQEMPSPSIGNRALDLLSPGEAEGLARKVLRELLKVWAFNRRQGELRVALDGQMSNWAIGGFDPQRPHLAPEAPLLYLDTSTPLYRVEGVEQLDPELFLRSAPSFLVWLLRLLFLQDVLDRYYDLRRVVIDLLANLYKERRADLVPRLVAVANECLAQEARDLRLQPIREEEVRAYYREDAMIWGLYQAMRRVDRFLRGRRYPYILPDWVWR